jgi:putative inorganic carbon (hco3(-)) transporter
MTLYYLLLLVTPFHYDPRLGKVLFNAGVMIVTPVKLIGLLTVAAALLASLPSDSAARLRHPLLWFFVPFAIVPVFVTFARGLPTPSLYIGQLISAALLFMATRPLVRTQQRMFKVTRTLATAFAFSSLWVYKQYFLEGATRIWGLEGDANYEALMLMLTLPMAFWMWRYERSSWWRWIGLGCGLLLAGAVVLTESRAGIIAGGAVALLAAARSKHKLIGIAQIAALAWLIFNYGPTGLTRRFQGIKFTGRALNGNELSTRAHYELLKAGVRMMESRPVFGVGPGQFKKVAPEYNSELLDLEGHSWIAHDTFVQIGAESGIPALLLFIAMIAVALHNFRIARRSSDLALGALGGAMQLGLMSTCIAGLAITVELLPFWILIFLSQSLREIAGPAPRAAWTGLAWAAFLPTSGTPRASTKSNGIASAISLNRSAGTLYLVKKNVGIANLPQLNDAVSRPTRNLIHQDRSRSTPM